MSVMKKYKDEYVKLEDNLKISYERFRYECENKVIDQLDTDPSALYRYARKKSVISSNIGPLRDKNNTLHYDKKMISEILADQYSGMCTQPLYYIFDDNIYKSSDT